MSTTRETPLQVAVEMLTDARLDMVSCADLLHTRLGKLIERGEPAMGFDLPTIVGLLMRMRDSIEMYRRAEAVVEALGAAPEAGATGGDR